MFRRKEEQEAKTETEKCEHDFTEKVDYEEKCDLCGITLKIRYFRKCRKCGHYDYRWEKINESKRVNYYRLYKGAYGQDIWSMKLCLPCFEKFRKYVKDLVNQIMEAIKIAEIEFLEYRTVVFKNPDQILGFLREFCLYCSKPKEEWVVENEWRSMYGISMYVKPKNPLETPYKIVIPYNIVLKGLKEKTKHNVSSGDVDES